MHNFVCWRVTYMCLLTLCWKVQAGVVNARGFERHTGSQPSLQGYIK